MVSYSFIFHIQEMVVRKATEAFLDAQPLLSAGFDVGDVSRTVVDNNQRNLETDINLIFTAFDWEVPVLAVWTKDRDVKDGIVLGNLYKKLVKRIRPSGRMRISDSELATIGGDRKSKRFERKETNHYLQWV